MIKIKTFLLMAILAPITLTSIEAQITTISLSFSEANRSDDLSYLCSLVGQADTFSYAAIDANAPTAARSSAPRVVGKGTL
jgi:hypothetical protein